MSSYFYAISTDVIYIQNKKYDRFILLLFAPTSVISIDDHAVTFPDENLT
jgi:hypothetical protein